MSTRSGKGGVHPVVLMVDTAPTNGKIDIKGEASHTIQGHTIHIYLLAKINA